MNLRKKPKATINLTERALVDIRETERFSIKEWSRKAAEKYLGDIGAARDRLGEDPEILRLEPGFVPGLHFYRVRKHVLVCDFQSDTVIVLTVIHTSMDLPARLQELEPRLVAESQMLQARLHRKAVED